MWNTSTCECNKAYKVDKYIDIKYCSCERRLTGKCKDEILNITETSIDDKKLTLEKSNCPIHTISLIIM